MQKSIAIQKTGEVLGIVSAILFAIAAVGALQGYLNPPEPGLGGLGSALLFSLALLISPVFALIASILLLFGDHSMRKRVLFLAFCGGVGLLSLMPLAMGITEFTTMFLPSTYLAAFAITLVPVLRRRRD